MHCEGELARLYMQTNLSILTVTNCFWSKVTATYVLASKWACHKI
jgi:hypothetical protein